MNVYYRDLNNFILYSSNELIEEQVIFQDLDEKVATIFDIIGIPNDKNKNNVLESSDS